MWTSLRPGMLAQEGLIGLLQARAQADLRRPAERAQPVCLHQLAQSTVGLGEIFLQRPIKAR